MAKSFGFLVLAVLIGSSAALECVQIPDNQILLNHRVFIPAGANDTVEIPPNYSCTYLVKVPPMMYGVVHLENGLKGNNDLITVYDEQATRTLVAARSPTDMPFYIFPNTTTKFQVVTKSVNMHSAFRLDVFYAKMLPATVTRLDNTNLRYFMLNDLQANSMKTPQTVQANEKISFSIARSGWDSDLFTNYFLVEGDLQKPKAIYRMSSLSNQNYISTGNTLTVVGLDNRVSESSVVFTPLSQAQQFDSLTSFGVYFEANELNINAKIGEKKKSAVNVIGMKDYVRVLSVDKSSAPCSLKAVAAPPSSTSEIYLDFSTVTSYPVNIPHKSFAIVAENCAASFKLVSLDY